MCLGVPGKVVRVEEDPLGLAKGQVSFGGILKDVSFAYLPDVKPGDFVLVHVGFALSKIDETEAGEVFRLLEEMGEMAELGEGRPEGPTS